MPNKWASQLILGWPWKALFLVIWISLSGCQSLTTEDEGFNVSVQESMVYSTADARNGAGPLWNFSSSNIARIGDTVWVSGLNTVTGMPPLNNTECTLWKQAGAGWIQIATLPGLTREPCPIGVLNGERLVISTNPTLNPPGKQGGGPARPGLWEYDPARPDQPPVITEPKWRPGAPVDKFTEHSYRSMAVDGARGEIFLMQNIGYTHAEWTFRNSQGQWASQGKLDWPVKNIGGRDTPLRVCYTVALIRDRAVHLLGVSDVMEPIPEWRAFKKILTGKQSDYVFRNLYYTWTPDITSVPFQPWLEVASREETAGRIVPGDLWLGSDDVVHAVWEEAVLDARLRKKFFPAREQVESIGYARIRVGRILERSALLANTPELNGGIPHSPRLHVTPVGKIFLFLNRDGPSTQEPKVAGNVLIQLKSGVPLSQRELPFSPANEYVIATSRLGNSPSKTLDVLSNKRGDWGVQRHLRINIFPNYREH